jgi:hypothetical protein
MRARSAFVKPVTFLATLKANLQSWQCSKTMMPSGRACCVDFDKQEMVINSFDLLKISSISFEINLF